MLQGPAGTDLIVPVPKGVCVTTDSGEIIGKIRSYYLEISQLIFWMLRLLPRLGSMKKINRC